MNVLKLNHQRKHSYSLLWINFNFQIISISFFVYLFEMQVILNLFCNERHILFLVKYVISKLYIYIWLESHLKNIVIFISPKVKEQTCFKSKLKIPHLQIYHPRDIFDLILKKFALFFLKVNFYSNNRGVKGISIMFPLIFMFFFWAYMHDTR